MKGPPNTVPFLQNQTTTTNFESLEVIGISIYMVSAISAILVIFGFIWSYFNLTKLQNQPFIIAYVRLEFIVLRFIIEATFS